MVFRDQFRLRWQHQKFSDLSVIQILSDLNIFWGSVNISAVLGYFLNFLGFLLSFEKNKNLPPSRGRQCSYLGPRNKIVDATFIN